MRRWSGVDGSVAGLTIALAAAGTLAGLADGGGPPDGFVAYRDGDLAGARAAFEQELATDRNAPVPLANLACVLTASRQYEEAEVLLRRALEQPSAATVRAPVAFDLGNVLLAQDRPAEAVIAYRESLRLAPDDLACRENLEIALRRLPRNHPATPPGVNVAPPSPHHSGAGGSLLSREEAERLLDALERRERLALPQREQQTDAAGPDR